VYNATARKLSLDKQQDHDSSRFADNWLSDLPKNGNLELKMRLQVIANSPMIKRTKNVQKLCKTLTYEAKQNFSFKPLLRIQS